MSKKITHKEHRQLLSELYKKQGGKWIYQADAYIKQAQKQEKLLELYRKHYKLVPFMPGLGDNAKTVIDNSRKIEQIEKEINYE